MADFCFYTLELSMAFLAVSVGVRSLVSALIDLAS